MLNKLRTATSEWYAVLISFFYYFSILAAYYVMRPIRDQLAAEMGSRQLPWSFGATFAATLLLTPLFAWSVSRWPRRVVIPFVYVFFMAGQTVFIFLFSNQELLSLRYLGTLFFVWVSVFNLFVVSVFWSFMSDIWSEPKARRWFPLIGLGGLAGAILGPILTSQLVAVSGASFLLIVSCSLLFISIACIVLLGRWASKCGPLQPAEALGGKMLDGLRQVFSHAFMRTVAVMMVLNDATGTIAYVLITDYSAATFANDAIAQIRFAAHLDLAANIMQMLVQLSITRWLLVRCGASGVFALAASLMAAFCMGVVLFTNPSDIAFKGLPWIALLHIATRALSYGMLQPARESLYTLVPRTMRYKGKNAVDTVIWRAGDVMSLSCVSLFRSLGMGVVGFGLIWATFTSLSGWLGWRLAKRLED